MTTRKSTSIVIKTDQSEDGKWSWVCVMDDELVGVGVDEASREDAQQIALKLVNTLMGSED